MESNVTLKINDQSVSVPDGSSVLQAADKLHIKIPTLCNHPDLQIKGNCRVCMVNVKGYGNLQASCALPAVEGMEVFTNTEEVRRARKTVIALLLSEHNCDCLHCYKSGSCELQSLAMEYTVEAEPFINISNKDSIDLSSAAVIKDNSKCIRCQRCVRSCAELEGVHALTASLKGEHMKISTFMDIPWKDSICTNCGQCVNRCPTGALVERNYIEDVWHALADPDKHVVVQTAPAVRISLGELLGFDLGARVTGKMVSALRQLGFNSVFDTDFTADLTIIEEGTELLTRLKRKLVEKEDISIPLITSCSPGWIKFIEHRFPSALKNLSTCKSPQQMFGALAKTYYAQKAQVDPAKIVVVSIMPCTAKKFEADRPEMSDSGYRDVDYVLTTRELGHMIKQAGIDFTQLKDSRCDSLLGEATGAGVIFGSTGGVMEAALRTAYELVTGREVPFKNLDIVPVRGMAGVRTASIKFEDCLPDWDFLNGVELNLAVSHGLANVPPLVKDIVAGKSPYHFIEIMACPGGCLGGGGQPIPTNMEVRQRRMDAIYGEDHDLPLRKSHENPEVKKIYQDFLGEPLGEMSHKLLHTQYCPRMKF